jgi:GNAT superfamily N-acetyltransferase
MSKSAPRSIVDRLWRRIWSRKELRIYRCTAEQIAALPRTGGCRRDRWDDFDACTAWSYGHLTRDDYLRLVEQRRLVGCHHLYSLVEDDTLVHYGWLSYPQDRAPDAALGLEFIPPPGSAALWDYFTHPRARGRGLYLRTLWQCLHDAVEIDGARQVFIYVYADNEISKRVIERAGFEYLGSLIADRRPWGVRRYAIFTKSPLDVRLMDSGRRAETRQQRRAVLALENEKEGESVISRPDRAGRGEQLEPGRSRKHAV